MSNSAFTAAFWRGRTRRTGRAGVHAARQVFLVHHRVIEAVILLVGLMIIGFVIGTIVFRSPADTGIPIEPALVGLATEELDELELWLEERQSESERSFEVPARVW